MPARVRRLVAGLALAAATVSLAAAVVLTPVASAQSVTTAKSKAISYFHRTQLTSGGFGASGRAAFLTPWVVQAIAAAGRNAATFKRSGGKSALAYLQSLNVEQQALSGSGTTDNPATVYAKLILSYRAARVPALIGKAGSRNIDLVSYLLKYRNAQSGAFTTQAGGGGSYAAVSTTTWAVLALRAAGRSAAQVAGSVSWLSARQASNGGFSFTPAGSTDVDSTSAVVEALRAGGLSASAPVIKRAISYLHAQQKTNGGFISAIGTPTTNAESTAWAVQAIRAVGQNPAGSSWKKGGKTPIAFLLSLQASSGAFYHYGKTLATPLVTTSEVIVALSGKTYPF